MKRQNPSLAGRSSWRPVAAIIVGLLLLAPGCRSWSNPYPLPNPSRVPAPPTGSYPATGNYYGAPANGTPQSFGASAPAGGVSSAGFQSGVPSTDLSQVASAGYTSPNVWTNQSQFQAGPGNAVQPASIDYTNQNSGGTAMREQPSLDWR